MKLVYDIKDNRSSLNEYQSTAFDNLQNKLNRMKAALSLHEDVKLNISYEDIMKIPTHGRWWLAGAARKGQLVGSSHFGTKDNNGNGDGGDGDESVWKETDINTSAQPEPFSAQILEMAKKFHMNTPIRKAVFCIVMSSEDYMDAFSKLSQLNLSEGKHQEMIRIVLLLALRQKTYGRYYYLLLEKLLKEKKHWRFAFQCAVWDKFKELTSMNDNDIINLAKLLGEMICSQVIKMTVLKSLDLMKVCQKNLLLVYTLFDGIFDQHLRRCADLHKVFSTFCGNKEMRDLRAEIIMFLTSVMKPKIDAQISALKKHKKENTAQQQRDLENKKLALGNAIQYMQDYMDVTDKTIERYFCLFILLI
ncbi:hypothetical protein RFI_09753 [Reticulomyxa filosa]|uniref:MI domain-containing protein n=1 Tax=Reticulomyxa filosa TaxID=46433 RepID=X6NN89_RETFI|nr:hypothetical protein RFI_09753 [Reticulomyxa filosa]|eukprot:ETO27378.1 hypothetical protein RFI_09753 [Reticulomyxa filosa]